MSDALLAGVSGLKAHQKMIDVTGHNLANVNTTGFKSSRTTFAELLSETLREASQGTGSRGGTDPVQIGNGVMVAGVNRNMSQGSLMNTGEPLDMAIEGAGYFVVNDGQQDLFTRAGQFAIDSEYYLVDPSTGFRVQRIGSEGLDEGFQSVANNSIRIPKDVAMPAKATENVTYTGNLGASEENPTTNQLSSVMAYTKSGMVASADMHLDELDQAAGLTAASTITVYGTKRDGTELGGGAGVAVDLHDGADFLTVQELMDAITAAYQIGGEDVSVAELSNGEIQLTDLQSGYSKTDMWLEYSGAAGSSFELPGYFKVLSSGGKAVRATNITVYDTQGVGHVLAADFVRTDTANTWDLLLTSLSGDVQLVDRRVEGITFLGDGSYGGIQGGDTPEFKVIFGNEPSNTRTINLGLGTIGEYNGLSQLGEISSVAPSGQDGYASGWLSNLSVTRSGVLVGIFTNGVREDIAALRLATFQNPAGLYNMGGNYFSASSNSGDPVPTRALEGGAGSIHGGSLEKSNVEVATEFVNLIQAQNGYQANARTIRVANDILGVLTGLIR